mmetsp:Transcript_114348/g.198848  ORF Transcript_114348/g.198848 Transcript_114348/m.198848 type:complete len:85 (+) Transcript_114348:1381-1635(+)
MRRYVTKLKGSLAALWSKGFMNAVLWSCLVVSTCFVSFVVSECGTAAINGCRHAVMLQFVVVWSTSLGLEGVSPALGTKRKCSA